MATFEAAGITLANPSTGVITAITNGPESWGEQIQFGRSDLFTALALRSADELNFQLWLDSNTDVFTRVRRFDGLHNLHLPGGDGVVVEFGLDGMTAEEREAVVHAAWQAVASDGEDTIGVVLDRRGVTEDVDWDGLVTGAGVRWDEWPDLLGVRPEVATRHVQLAGAAGRTEPPLTMFGSLLGT
ncbi:hypothetical protein [Streptomyces justiciae]|uniref:Uncharacterized protein n=1 Tax=Streptomyces justiciae TaxID=2780140 RepID=A0ABU3LP14_9ACTN|nr:hypothetical protein [Streptomyces justiciae]MDT7840977.1 hypothetical protein [Streptomyces justiciae]